MHIDLTVPPTDDSPIDLAKVSKITIAPRVLLFVFLAGMVIGLVISAFAVLIVTERGSWRLSQELAHATSHGLNTQS